MHGKYRLIAFSLAIGFALGQSGAADRIERDGMNHWRDRYGRDRDDAMYHPNADAFVGAVSRDRLKPNWDGRKGYSLSEAALERRTGYAWYGSWPARILERDYPAWKARLNQR